MVGVGCICVIYTPFSHNLSSSACNLYSELARNRSVFLVKLLLDMGIDPNRAVRLGETALTGALRTGFEDGYGEAGEIVKILLKHICPSCFRQELLQMARNNN